MGLSQGLFRQEVIDARRGDWLGSIVVATPLSRWWLSALALVAAGSIVAFLCLGHYTRRETVSGQLVPSAGLLNVVAPGAGTVTRLLAHDGQAVKAGDVLLDISSEQNSASLGDTHALVGQQLATQRARLQDDLANQAQSSRQQGEALLAKAALLRAQLAQVDGQLDLQRQQVDGNRQMLERIEPLVANCGPADRRGRPCGGRVCVGLQHRQGSCRQ